MKMGRRRAMEGEDKWAMDMGRDGKGIGVMIIS